MADFVQHAIHGYSIEYLRFYLITAALQAAGVPVGIWLPVMAGWMGAGAAIVPDLPQLNSKSEDGYQGSEAVHSGAFARAARKFWWFPFFSPIQVHLELDKPFHHGSKKLWWIGEGVAFLVTLFCIFGILVNLHILGWVK